MNIRKKSEYPDFSKNEYPEKSEYPDFRKMNIRKKVNIRILEK